MKPSNSVPLLKMPCDNAFLISHTDSFRLLQMQGKLKETKVTVGARLNVSTRYLPLPTPVTYLYLFMLSIQERSKLQISPQGRNKGTERTNQNHTCV